MIKPEKRLRVDIFLPVPKLRNYIWNFTVWKNR